MKITKRERWLLGVTITVIVVGVNYFLVIPLLRSWRDTGDRLRTQERELALIRATIQREPQWRKQYDELRQSLGQRTESFQKVSDVEKKIVEVATSAGVQLTSRRSLQEEDKGVYRVLPEQCALEATTESLVRFLFALQTGSGFMSIEQLQVSPRPENPGILRCDIQVRALATKQGNPKS
jgi:Tfp pilus assembly protein PilO